MGKRKVTTTIMRIREAIKDLRHDVRDGKMPRIVLKRIISCMDDVVDVREKEDIDYPLPYILLMAFLV